MHLLANKLSEKTRNATLMRVAFLMRSGHLLVVLSEKLCCPQKNSNACLIVTIEQLSAEKLACVSRVGSRV